MKVTACLITWKRQENIPKIIESLLKYDFIDEIIIQDNSKGENIINYGRYVSAEKAKNDIIFVQDDDHIIHNISEIYKKYLKNPDKLCNGGIEDYLKVVPENIYGTSQMAIVGWGSFFNKNWIPVLQKYIDIYGKDYCFYRETDRIFSMLLNKHHTMIKSDVSVLGGAVNSDALSQQSDHIRYKNLAIARCKEILHV